MVLRPAAKILRLACAALAAALLTAGCGTGPQIPLPSFATADSTSIERTYRLGVGDKLRVTVFGEDNISGQYEINALGNVSVPLVGDVPAQGMAISAFRDTLSKRLSDGYLRNPRVNVEVLNYRAIYVHGEVKNGGEFGYKNGLRLRDAIAMAGGFTYRADESYVVVVREGVGEGSVPMSSNAIVLPGDNIRVPERFF
ncbi:MAG: polysaccharide biosynthesis/export family protein [Hyphomicrobiaceae bacterium]